MLSPGPPDIALALRGQIARSDLPRLCKRVCAALRESGAVVACDVASVLPDAATIDALARLQLAARKRGCCVRLLNASAELLDLVDFMGLTHVLSERSSALLGELERKPEARELRLDVEEERELDDPAVLDLEHL
jgi:ABC-type transporter Mla MlaB component